MKSVIEGALSLVLNQFQEQGINLTLQIPAEIPLELQGKLLRVLQEKEFYRVGGLIKIKTDVRSICATNSNLGKMVENGTFRWDLFYRLKVGLIRIPPLREQLYNFVRKIIRPKDYVAWLEKQCNQGISSVGTLYVLFFAALEEFRYRHSWRVNREEPNESFPVSGPGQIGYMGMAAGDQAELPGVFDYRVVH